MYQDPIDEKQLLESIPGFNNLTEDELRMIRVSSFEFRDGSLLSTATLRFSYNGHELLYEMSFSRKEGFCYQHVMCGEEEFPSFREAIGFCGTCPTK